MHWAATCGDCSVNVGPKLLCWSTAGCVAPADTIQAYHIWSVLDCLLPHNSRGLVLAVGVNICNSGSGAGLQASWQGSAIDVIQLDLWHVHLSNTSHAVKPKDK